MISTIGSCDCCNPSVDCTSRDRTRAIKIGHTRFGLEPNIAWGSGPLGALNLAGYMTSCEGWSRTNSHDVRRFLHYRFEYAITRDDLNYGTGSFVEEITGRRCWDPWTGGSQVLTPEDWWWFSYYGLMAVDGYRLSNTIPGAGAPTVTVSQNDANGIHVRTSWNGDYFGSTAGYIDVVYDTPYTEAQAEAEARALFAFRSLDEVPDGYCWEIGYDYAAGDGSMLIANEYPLGVGPGYPLRGEILTDAMVGISGSKVRYIMTPSECGGCVYTSQTADKCAVPTQTGCARVETTAGHIDLLPPTGAWGWNELGDCPCEVEP